MNVFQRLFGQKMPLKKNDIPNFGKVTEFTIWFIKNEPFVNTISNRSCNIIFNEGYRPTSGTQNNPESIKPDINSLAEWFIVKVFIDLNMLKDATKDEFRQFIDIGVSVSKEALITSVEIGSKYNLDFERFDYEREIQKVPAGPEREWLKFNLLNDDVLSAEVRILAWLYHEYFGEWYQLKEEIDE